MAVNGSRLWKFILVVSLNTLILVLVLEVLSGLILGSYNYFSRKLSWYWIHVYDREMETPIGSDTLVLGCSVAQQLFPFHFRPNYKVTTGVDIGASSFLYGAKAIEKNPGLRVIIIISIPYSLTQSFGSKYSYYVFIKPYYSFSNFRYFDGYLHREIARKPFALMAAFSFFKILPISDFDFREDPSDRPELSDFNVHYLGKLRKLAYAHRIRVVILPSPIPESVFIKQKHFRALKSSVFRMGFGDIFHDYFDRFVVFPDSCFRDGMHFRQDFLERNRVEIIRKLKLSR